ncbi:hypothetical protein ES707_14430 [subsurface metagenome]
MEGGKRIGTSGDSMPFGTELLCVGPLIVGVAAGLDFNVYVPKGMGKIRVKKVRSFLTVALAGGTDDSVVTVKNVDTPMTGGTLTITQPGTIGDEDSCDIVNDENAVVAEETAIVLSAAARASGTGGQAIFFIEYERCQ